MSTDKIQAKSASAARGCVSSFCANFAVVNAKKVSNKVAIEAGLPYIPAI